MNGVEIYRRNMDGTRGEAVLIQPAERFEPVPKHGRHRAPEAAAEPGTSMDLLRKRAEAQAAAGNRFARRVRRALSRQDRRAR